jgi:hypothetical protein
VIRRLLSVLSGLAMLHLTLVGQLPCAPDSSATPAHSMDAMDMGAMAMDGSHATESHHKSSEQQAPQRCCEAMSGCAVSITIAAATRVVTSAHATTDIPISDHVALLSFRTAPEPPPPKA